jgi:transcriptional regulator with XRE-family HTH domain
MPRSEKIHIVGDTPTNMETPKHLSKQEFARRLFKMMMTAKGLIQADLARATGLSRNNISTYIRGQCFPTQRSLELLASALNCTADELLPNVRESALRAETQPDMSLQSSVADPNRSWLTVNRLVTTSVAIKIMALLNEDKHGTH